MPTDSIPTQIPCVLGFVSLYDIMKRVDIDSSTYGIERQKHLLKLTVFKVQNS